MINGMRGLRNDNGLEDAGTINGWINGIINEPGTV